MNHLLPNHPLPPIETLNPGRNLFGSPFFHQTTPDISSHKFVGLKNQGATCYMNSVLQFLFHLPIFRRLVFEIDSQNHERNTPDSANIILNLQILFAEMQLQLDKKAIATDNLTQSFGWKASDSFTQHDVQEFLRVLLDNIENKLKNTEKADTIKYIFGGTFRTYIINSNHELQKYIDNDFYDISLELFNQQNNELIPDLYSSFHHYIADEKLSGDNQYQSEENVKQDVFMRTRFMKLPRVLCLQLKRFQIDQEQGQSIKINSFFQFDKTINLSQYVADEIRNDLYQKSHGIDEPINSTDILDTQFLEHQYDLFGILVHSGTSFSGHYTAYLNPSLSNQWYQFNDSIVNQVSENNAIEDNFGGNDRNYSAYMLIYVKTTDKDSLFTEVEPEVIPENIINHIQRENEMVKSSIEMFTAHLFTPENSIIPSSIAGGLEFWSFQDDATRLQLPQNLTLDDLYNNAAHIFSTENSQIELWQFYKSGLIETIDRSNLSLTRLPKSMNLFVFIEKGDEDLEVRHSFDSSFDLGDDDGFSLKGIFPLQIRIPIFAFVYCPLVKPRLNFLFSYKVDSELSIIDYFATVVTRKLYHGNASEADHVKMTKSMMNVFLKRESEIIQIRSDQQTFQKFATSYNTIQSELFVIELTNWDYFEIPKFDKTSYSMNFFHSHRNVETYNFFNTQLVDRIETCEQYLQYQSDMNSIRIKCFLLKQKITVTYPNLITFGLFKQFIFNIFEPLLATADNLDFFEESNLDSGITTNETSNNRLELIKNLQVLCYCETSVQPLFFNDSQLMLTILSPNNKKLSVVFLNNSNSQPVLRVFILISHDAITVSEKVEFTFPPDSTVSDIFQKVISYTFSEEIEPISLRALQLSSNSQKIIHIIDPSTKLVDVSNPIRIERFENNIGSQFISVAFDIESPCNPFLLDLSHLPKDIDQITIGQIKAKAFDLLNYQNETNLIESIDNIQALKFTFFDGEHCKITNLNDDTLFISIDPQPTELLIASYPTTENDSSLRIYN